MYHDADNLDTAFDAGGKVSIGLTATTIVSQWTWSATLLQSSTVASKVIFHCSADGRSENMWVRGVQGVITPLKGKAVATMTKTEIIYPKNVGA